MKHNNPAHDVVAATRDILGSLIVQKDALIAAVSQASGYDKSLTDQLCNIGKSIERLGAMDQQFRQLETAHQETTRSEMRSFMKAVDERITSLVTQDRADLVAQVLEHVCASCGTELRRLGIAPSAAATTP